MGGCTLDASSRKGVEIVDANLLMLSIAVGDTLRNVFVWTPGASVIAGLLALSCSATEHRDVSFSSPGIAPGQSVSEDSP